MKQKIIVTALPNGINPETKWAKFSIAISLQLTGIKKGTTLSDVQDLLHWHSLIGKAGFQIQVNSQPPVMAHPKNAAPPGAPFFMMDADPLLWDRLFTKEINVNDFVVEDNTQTPIYSYPVKLIADHIKTIVETTGKQYANDLPGKDFYTTGKDSHLFTDVSNYKLTWVETGKENFQSVLVSSSVGNTIRQQFQQQTFIPFDEEMKPGIAFGQLCNFHGMYHVRPVKDSPDIAKPNFEFHDILSVLSNHPALLRRLGLVIDFEIPSTLFPPSGTIRVFPESLDFSEPFVQTEINCPPTAYELTKQGFYTKAKPESFYAKGHVKINNNAFTIFQIDTDGAAIKLVSHIDALQLKAERQKNFYLRNTPDSSTEPAAELLKVHVNELQERREGLPTIRSAGIAIAKNGLANYLSDRFKRTNFLVAALAGNSDIPSGISKAAGKNVSYTSGTTNTNSNDLSEPVLYADDVIIGYRMDVANDDKADDWHSLHFHENKYSYIDAVSQKNVVIGNIGKDEGFIQLTTSTDLNITEPPLQMMMQRRFRCHT